MGRKPPTTEIIALKERRARLQDRIDQFSGRVAALWPTRYNENLPSLVQELLEADDLLSDESEDEEGDDSTQRAQWQAEWAPELAKVFGPTINFGLWSM